LALLPSPEDFPRALRKIQGITKVKTQSGVDNLRLIAKDFGIGGSGSFQDASNG
jgi:hypothetical protein